MNEDYELIPNTGVKKKDVKDFHVTHKGKMTCYHVTLISKGGRCPDCGKYVTRVHSRKRKKIPHYKDVLIFYEAARYRCSCGRTFYEENPFQSKDPYISDAAVDYILTEIKRYNHCFSEIAEALHISVTKVIEVFDAYVQIPRKPLREVISIDEFHFSSRSRSKYAFLIMGLNGEILDVLDSRKKSPLLDYFQYIPKQERDRVKYVTMNMNENYRDVVRRRLKNAVICIDSFHVVQLLSDKLDTVRKKVMKRYEKNKRSREYYLLKHRYKLLFRSLGSVSVRREYNHHYRLPMSESELLDDILKIDEELKRAYFLKEDYLSFNASFPMEKKEEHERMIDELIEGFLHSDSRPMIEFGNTLISWKEEILNSFISYKGNRLSNGKIENKNKYIKKIKDIANGYSNFRRFRNRIMYSENPFEKPSEERIGKQVKRKMPKRGPYKKE